MSSGSSGHGFTPKKKPKHPSVPVIQEDYINHAASAPPKPAREKSKSRSDQARLLTDQNPLDQDVDEQRKNVLLSMSVDDDAWPGLLKDCLQSASDDVVDVASDILQNTIAARKDNTPALRAAEAKFKQLETAMHAEREKVEAQLAQQEQMLIQLQVELNDAQTLIAATTAAAAASSSASPTWSDSWVLQLGRGTLSSRCDPNLACANRPVLLHQHAPNPSDSAELPWGWKTEPINDVSQLELSSSLSSTDRVKQSASGTKQVHIVMPAVVANLTIGAQSTNSQSNSSLSAAAASSSSFFRVEKKKRVFLVDTAAILKTLFCPSLVALVKRASADGPASTL